MKKMLPLEGVRIIEVGQALAAPLAATIMADMGADVIKVEKPDGGGKFPSLSEQLFIRATGDRKRMPLACG
jgi:crotonobetainyl-CoA:carnitine CoA-transferase CaiB-like acyl-CoA transferase